MRTSNAQSETGGISSSVVRGLLTCGFFFGHWLPSPATVSHSGHLQRIMVALCPQVLRGTHRSSRARGFAGSAVKLQAAVSLGSLGAGRPGEQGEPTRRITAKGGARSDTSQHLTRPFTFSRAYLGLGRPATSQYLLYMPSAGVLASPGKRLTTLRTTHK
jgi:hypothetical protein